MGHRSGLSGRQYSIEHRVGICLGKNRDRNGNGKIDYNEILWYLPAYTELQAIAGHISGGSRSYPREYSRTVDVDWEMEPYSFFSSTPSSSDAAGITAGFSWAVQFSPNAQKTASEGRDALALHT